MHPAILLTIFLREPTLFMPDVSLKYETRQMKNEKMQKEKKEKYR
jgi:hypothetical protein